MAPRGLPPWKIALAEIAAAERTGDWTRAEALLARASAGSAAPFWQVRRGELLWRRGRAAEALVLAEAILRGRPDHPGARRLAAACLVRLRRWAEAEALLAGGEGLDPRAACLLARARRRTAGAEAALEVVRRARLGRPAAAALAREEADLLGRLGRWAEAAEAWREAAELAGSASPADWLSARLRPLPPAEAAAQLARLLALPRFGTDARVHALLARTLERAGRPGEAAAAWRTARARAGSADPRTAAAAVYGLRRCGARAEVHAALRALVAADPRDCAALSALIYDARALGGGAPQQARRFLLDLARRHPAERHLWGWIRRLGPPRARS